MEHYLGIPHTKMNCLELVQHVLEREYGKTLIVPQADDFSAVHNKAFPDRCGAQKTDTPEPGDVVLFHGSQYAHVGLLLKNNDVLHSLEDRGSEITKLSVLMRRFKIEGFYKGIPNGTPA